ncbi:MAG: carboxylesterase family protein [Gemmatimonadaceae bacterium]
MIPRLRAFNLRTVMLCCALPIAGMATAQRPRVTTQAGIVEGIVDASSGVAVFRGIPYSAPPTGDLRWRAPKPTALEGCA